MNAIDIIRTGVRNFAIAIKAIPSNLQAVTSRGWFRVSESYAGAWQQNVEVSLENVLSHPTVFACFTLIAFDVAKLRLKLVQEQEADIWTEFESPAFSPVIRKPNHFQNRIQFFVTWMLSKLVNGNVYVLKVRDSRRVVVSLYVLDPNRVRPLVAPNGDVYYEVKRDDLSRWPFEVEAIPAAELMHDIYCPLFHPLVGVGPLHASGVTATQSLHIQSNATNFHANSAQPGGVLTAPGTIPQETADRLKTAWETNYSGDNAGKVAILGDGLKYEPLKVMTATDAQVVEQLKWSDEKICSACHVPGYKVGVGTPPPYNTVVQRNQEYYSDCLQIHIESIELLFDEGLGLAPDRIDGKRLGTEFDLEGLIRMDPVAQIEAEGNAVAKSLKAINEARRRLNLPPKTGGDAILSQQQYYSIEALAERDRNDPFAKPAPTPAPSSQPAPAEEKAAQRTALRREIELRRKRAA